jgi:hypothetical protein
MLDSQWTCTKGIHNMHKVHLWDESRCPHISFSFHEMVCIGKTIQKSDLPDNFCQQDIPILSDAVL